MKKNINWIYASLAMLFLSFLMYLILESNLDKDNASGIVGVCFLISFSQFFFLRRNLIYKVSTIVLFYSVGIIGAFIICFTQAIWLTLFLIYAFYIVMILSTSHTKIGKNVTSDIENEQIKRPWYKWLVATPTQQIENKLFIKDFAIFAFSIIVLVYILKSLNIT